MASLERRATCSRIGQQRVPSKVGALWKLVYGRTRVCVWLTRLTLSIALSVHMIPPATHTPSATQLHVHLEGLSLHAWVCLHLCVFFKRVLECISLALPFVDVHL